MLDIITGFGSFSSFKDVLFYMNDEKLETINILDVKYCLESIGGGNCSYTKEQIENIVSKL